MCIIRFPGIFFILLCYGLVELLQTVEEGVDGEELVEEEAEESENYSIAVRLQDLEEGVQQLSEQDRRRGEIERQRRHCHLCTPIMAFKLEVLDIATSLLGGLIVFSYTYKG